MGLLHEGGLFRRTTGAEIEQRKTHKPPIEMGLIGNPRVIENLQQAAELHRQGDPRAHLYHFVGIWPGHGQASIVQEGEMRALMDMNLLPLFDGHIAGSGGSGPVFAGLYNLVERWGDIFAEINPEIPLFQRGHLMLDELEQVFQERTPESFPSDTKIENVFVSVTNARTGRASAPLLDPHDKPITLLRASMSIPLMAPPTLYHGEPTIDGVVGDPLPISRVLYGSDFPNVTDIIVFAAAPPYDNEITAELAGQAIGLFDPENQTARLLRTQRERIRREMDFVTGKRNAVNKMGQPVRIVIIGPLKSSLSSFTLEGPTLIRARDIAQNYTADLLQK